MYKSICTALLLSYLLQTDRCEVEAAATATLPRGVVVFSHIAVASHSRFHFSHFSQGASSSSVSFGTAMLLFFTDPNGEIGDFLGEKSKFPRSWHALKGVIKEQAGAEMSIITSHPQ